MKKLFFTNLLLAMALFSIAQTSKTKQKTTTKSKPKTTTVAVNPIPADAVHFTENNKEDASIIATDKAIVIDGNDNKINITGNCKQIFITGKNNDITIESLDTIEITGSGNFVSWEKSGNASGKPIVKDKGGYNNVGKKSGKALNKGDN